MPHEKIIGTNRDNEEYVKNSGVNRNEYEIGENSNPQTEWESLRAVPFAGEQGNETWSLDTAMDSSGRIDGLQLTEVGDPEADFTLETTEKTKNVGEMTEAEVAREYLDTMLELSEDFVLEAPDATVMDYQKRAEVQEAGETLASKLLLKAGVPGGDLVLDVYQESPYMMEAERIELTDRILLGELKWWRALKAIGDASHDVEIWIDE